MSAGLKSEQDLVANNNHLRIIGGFWRSRQIQFINTEKIRPTPDRVRETLFNWLAGHIEGAVCLDLFAGSGALAFEAISRGGKFATLVDDDAKIVAQLKQQKEILQTNAVEIKQQHALKYVRDDDKQYDVIFLDPPFNSDQLRKVIPLLLEKRLLSSTGLLYVESPSNQDTPQELKTLICVREKITGEVRYALYSH